MPWFVLVLVLVLVLVVERFEEEGEDDVWSNRSISFVRGEFTLNGFRNRDIRERLHPGRPSNVEQKRQSSQISRLLRLFREHGLILKHKGTHRYQLTSQGRRILPAFIAARHANTEKLNRLAA